MWRAFLFVVLLAGDVAAQTMPPPCATEQTHDYVDSTYGGKVRQLVRPSHHEHNYYYLRGVWNADNSYMAQVVETLDRKTWIVKLYDGNTGCYIKDLYQTVPSLGILDWRLNWDRINPKVFYARQGNSLYSYNVDTQVKTLLKTFTGLNSVGSPSLNQDNTRIFMLGRDTDQTTVNNFNSYELPGMTNRRTFLWPAECTSDKEDERYIGYQNFIAMNCEGPKELRIYRDDGTLYHAFPNQYLPHKDFSPDGKVALFQMPGSGLPFTISVANIDGSNTQLLYSRTITQSGKMQNLHLSWPDKDPSYFIASLYPRDTATVPVPYTDPFDDLLQFKKNEAGNFIMTPLVRQRTAQTTSATENLGFWSQPLGNPSADGSRIQFGGSCFNKTPGVDCLDTNTIDTYIVYLSTPSPPEPPTNQPPVAEANGPYAGKVEEAVTFSSMGSYDPDGTLNAYAWDFGDETTSTEQNPSHTYATEGNFTATLRVSDAQGLSATDTATVVVTQEAVILPPVEGTTAEANGPYTAMMGSTITLSSDGSSGAAPEGGRITGTRWEFGDGMTSTEPHPSHTYSTAGSYTAKLTITDESCGTATDTTTILVTEPPSNQPPVAEANGPYTAKVGQPITLSSNGSTDLDGTIVSYLWTVSPGVTKTEANPSHTYTVAGTYTVSLVVMDSGGNTATDTATVTVSKPRAAE